MFDLPWLVYAAVAALLGALVGFIDNYMTDVMFDGKKAQAAKMVAGPIYVVIGVIIMLVVQPVIENIWAIILLVGSGIVAALASIPYYAGMEREEATSAKIFSQLIPVFSLVLAWIFLGQEITSRQLVAFAVMMLAPVIVTLAKDRRSKRHGVKSAGDFILYGLVYAASSLMFVEGTTLSRLDFWACLALNLLGKGSGDMLIMASQRKWRKHFYKEVRRHGAQLFAVVGLVIAVRIISEMLYRLAMIRADALALANASYAAIELVGTFFLGVLLSVLWPKFGREKLRKRVLLAHLVATVVAVVGVVLLA